MRANDEGMRTNWLSLNQTEGDEFAAETITAAWNAVSAKAALDIIEEPFELRPRYLKVARRLAALLLATELP